MAKQQPSSEAQLGAMKTYACFVRDPVVYDELQEKIRELEEFPTRISSSISGNRLTEPAGRG
jgi:hypothetical protein